MKDRLVRLEDFTRISFELKNKKLLKMACVEAYESSAIIAFASLVGMLKRDIRGEKDRLAKGVLAYALDATVRKTLKDGQLGYLTN